MKMTYNFLFFHFATNITSPCKPVVFQSFLWGTWLLSALTDFLLAQAVYFLFDHEVEELPTGL